jgi:hypothetical protein
MPAITESTIFVAPKFITNPAEATRIRILGKGNIGKEVTNEGSI